MVRPEELLKLTPELEDRIDYRLVKQGYTARQRQVIILRCQNRYIRDVSSALNIAQSTAEFHLSIIHKEVGCSDHRGLIEFVRELLR